MPLSKLMLTRFREVKMQHYGSMWSLKQESRQDDCPARHWRHWRQASTSPMTTRTVTLTIFPFLCWIRGGLWLNLYISIFQVGPDDNTWRRRRRWRPAYRVGHCPHTQKIERINKEIRYVHDVTMTAVASQITSISTVCSNVCSACHQTKHQTSASLAFVRGNYRWPVYSSHTAPVSQEKFPFDTSSCLADNENGYCTRQRSPFTLRWCYTLSSIQHDRAVVPHNQWYEATYKQWHFQIHFLYRKTLNFTGVCS